MFILNMKFKLKYYLKVCKYLSIFSPSKSVCTEMGMQLHPWYLLYSNLLFLGIPVKDCVWWVQKCNAVCQLFKYFLNSVENFRCNRSRRGKQLLSVCSSSTKIPNSTKETLHLPEFKRGKKTPPKSWNSFLICSISCAYLNQSCVSDLAVSAVKIAVDLVT